LTLDNVLRLAGLVAVCWVAYELHELRAQQYETTLRIGAVAADVELLRKNLVGASAKELSREGARRALDPGAKSPQGVVSAPAGASQGTLQRAIDEAASRSAAASAARAQR
jgi:hypothetical protein